MLIEVMTDRERERMLEGVAEGFARTAAFTGLDGPDPRVLEAMRRVPRHCFVPVGSRGRAYMDTPLPIGRGQTISQPFIVALMTSLLDTEPGDVVLEVGTGSGYQAAVLSQLVRHVYSVEILEDLASDAGMRLADLGYENVSVKCADGYHGWADHAPYDGIVVTACTEGVPEPLVEQLACGGRMVVPAGAYFNTQDLMLVTKDRSGKVRKAPVLPVSFVSLTGAHSRDRLPPVSSRDTNSCP